MVLNDPAISTLLERIREPETEASSLWENNLTGFKYDRGTIVGTLGAEGHTPGGSLGRRIGHHILQSRFRRMGTRFTNFKEYQRKGNVIVKRRGGLFDLSMMRQVLTLSLLSDHLPLDQIYQPIIIIGDGWGAMSSLILECLPQAKVVTVNLTKMLLVDLIYTRKAFPNIKIRLTDDTDEYQAALDDHNIRIVAVCASNSSIIGHGPIGLAINIASMQEMDPPVIAGYFTSLRNTPNPNTPFYCCNRVTKTLPDGTVVRFDDYPWRTDDSVLVDELCPWLQFSYRFRPPFSIPYDGPTRHRLAIMSEGNIS